MRIIGTMNRKGDALPERPHRRAQLIEVPATLGLSRANNSKR
jgi:hypothetical protein